MREKGFTLIEIILILIILSIVAITIMTNMGGFRMIKVSSAAKKVASDLRYAQQLSTTKQIIHGLSFTATGYTVYENDNPAFPANDPQGGGDFIVDYTAGVLEGITVAFNLPGGIVKFNSRGEALQGNGDPLVVGNDSVTLSYQGESKTVTVVPDTGKVIY